MSKYKAPYKIDEDKDRNVIVTDYNNVTVDIETICHALNQVSKLKRVEEFLINLEDYANYHALDRNEDYIYHTSRELLKLLQEEGE